MIFRGGQGVGFLVTGAGVVAGGVVSIVCSYVVLGPSPATSLAPVFALVLGMLVVLFGLGAIFIGVAIRMSPKPAAHLPVGPNGQPQLSEAAERKIAALWSSDLDRERVRLVLADCIRSAHGSERVARAILELCGGSAGKVFSLVAAARLDHREILLAAERLHDGR